MDGLLSYMGDYGGYELCGGLMEGFGSDGGRVLGEQLRCDAPSTPTL